jgi:hypothetical protein
VAPATVYSAVMLELHPPPEERPRHLW